MRDSNQVDCCSSPENQGIEGAVQFFDFNEMTFETIEAPYY
jgi:hypothetical protein